MPQSGDSNEYSVSKFRENKQHDENLCNPSCVDVGVERSKLHGHVNMLCTLSQSYLLKIRIH